MLHWWQPGEPCSLLARAVPAGLQRHSSWPLPASHPQAPSPAHAPPTSPQVQPARGERRAAHRHRAHVPVHARGGRRDGCAVFCALRRGFGAFAAVLEPLPRRLVCLRSGASVKETGRFDGPQRPTLLAFPSTSCLPLPSQCSSAVFPYAEKKVGGWAGRGRRMRIPQPTASSSRASCANSPVARSVALPPLPPRTRRWRVRGGATARSGGWLSRPPRAARCSSTGGLLGGWVGRVGCSLGGGAGWFGRPCAASLARVNGSHPRCAVSAPVTRSPAHPPPASHLCSSPPCAPSIHRPPA